MQYRTYNEQKRFSGRNGEIQINPDIFRTSPISGYSYLFGNANIVGHKQNTRVYKVINGNVLRDIWTLITSPVN